MKKLLLSAVLIGLATGVYAQGFISLDNNLNSGNATDTSNGRYFLNQGSGPVLTSGDFNAAFYGGTDSANLVLIASFSGAAATANSGLYGAGTWTDPSGSSYPVAGTTINSASAFFQIQAWTGNFASYAAALAGGAPVGQSPVFSNPVAGGAGTPPDFTAMPSITISSIPEPSTFALAGLGAAAMLIFRRRK